MKVNKLLKRIKDMIVVTKALFYLFALMLVCLFSPLGEKKKK